MTARRRALAAGALVLAGSARGARGAEAVRAASAPLAAPLRQWLQQHPEVRFGPERDYGPFVYEAGDGAVQGLSVDLLRQVAARTGLRLKTLPPRPLSPWLDAARRREVDVLSSLRPTPERGEYLLFTRPYVTVPALVVLRRGDALAAGVAREGLRALAARPVAVGQGYAVESVVRSRHPAVAWASVSDDAVALLGVAQARFDAAVVDAASLAHVVRVRRVEGLEPVAPVGFDYALSFAVRSDWPQLRDILDAGILALGPDERDRLLERWLSPALPKPGPSPWLWLGWGFVGAAALVAGGVTLHRRREGGG